MSVPEIRPLAIAGAAPIRMTNRIACSDSLNSRIAKGNQAMDGMVCSPVIIEPIALRRICDWETAPPIATPMRRAIA